MRNCTNTYHVASVLFSLPPAYQCALLALPAYQCGISFPRISVCHIIMLFHLPFISVCLISLLFTHYICVWHLHASPYPIYIFFSHPQCIMNMLWLHTFWNMLISICYAECVIQYIHANTHINCILYMWNKKKT